MSNIVLIAAIEAEEAARALQDGSLEDRARAAMVAVRGHWLATSEEDQFDAACIGLARAAQPDELERIESDLRSLRNLAALMDGVPVDVDAIVAAAEGVEPLGLVKLWHSTAEDAR